MSDASALMKDRGKVIFKCVSTWRRTCKFTLCEKFDFSRRRKHEVAVWFRMSRRSEFTRCGNARRGVSDSFASDHDVQQAIAPTSYFGKCGYSVEEVRGWCNKRLQFKCKLRFLSIALFYRGSHTHGKCGPKIFPPCNTLPVKSVAECRIM